MKNKTKQQQQHASTENGNNFRASKNLSNIQENLFPNQLIFFTCIPYMYIYIYIYILVLEQKRFQQLQKFINAFTMHTQASKVYVIGLGV